MSLHTNSRTSFPLPILSSFRLRFIAGVPYIFLTNGGGVPEAKRAQQLQDIFDIYVTPKQVCLSHSPMAPLSSKYQDDLVLVVGMHDVKEVAEMYGFTNVVRFACLLKPRMLPLSILPRMAFLIHHSVSLSLFHFTPFSPF